jgi:hypothetical protein
MEYDVLSTEDEYIQNYATNKGIIMANKLNGVIEPGVTGKYWIDYIN